jgi:DNA-damage-inducible protein J
MFLNDTIQLRIDKNTKRRAAQITEELGFDLSTAIKLYLKQIIINKGIPFNLRTENGFTSEFEEDLLKEEKTMMRLYKTGKLKGYSSIKEMHQDILKS